MQLIASEKITSLRISILGSCTYLQSSRSRWREFSCSRYQRSVSTTCLQMQVIASQDMPPLCIGWNSRELPQLAPIFQNFLAHINVLCLQKDCIPNRTPQSPLSTHTLGSLLTHYPHKGPICLSRLPCMFLISPQAEESPRRHVVLDLVLPLWHLPFALTRPHSHDILSYCILHRFPICPSWHNCLSTVMTFYIRPLLDLQIYLKSI